MSSVIGPDIVVDNSLVLNLDAANSKSYPGSGTTWYDLSGNGNHATKTGNGAYLTWDSRGCFYHNPGNAYFGALNSSSSGSTSNGAYWTIPSHASLDPSNGWSVCGIMDVAPEQSTNGGGWFVLGAADRCVHLEPISSVTFRANGVSGWSHLNPNISSYANTFVYYAFTFEQVSGTYGTDAGTLKFYINGELNSTQSAFIPTATANYSIDLGRRHGHLYHFLHAYVANYQYYTRALSASEIKQNYNAMKGRFNI